MKSVVYFLFVLALASCSQTQSSYYKESVEPDKLNTVEITINYDRPIEEYDVTVTCLVDTTKNTDSPQSQGNKSAIVGKGYIHFKNEDADFVVENPCFTDSLLLENKIELKNGLTLKAAYLPFSPITNKGMILMNANTPFFFYDIDMDGEKELVVTLFEGMEYHSHNSYEVYKINSASTHQKLIHMTQPPFDRINDYTEFDFIKRTITPHEVDAVKLIGDTVYKMQ